MATLTKQFNYNTDLESWSATVGGATSLVMGRDTTEDSSNDTNAGTGVMQARRTGKNVTDGTPYWEWAGTWEDLGVPAGATVTAVDLDYDSKCSEYTTGATSTVGPSELRDSGGSLRSTFRAADNVSATSAWVTRDGSASGIIDASNTTIRLRVGVNPKTGNSSSAAVTLRLDWVVVTVTYTPVGGAWTLVASDDFNRANNASSLGSPWTTISGTWGISGNAPYAPSLVSTRAVATRDDGLADGMIELDLIATPADSTGYAIAFRTTDINNRWEMVIYRSTGSYTGWAVFLQYWNAAVFTRLLEEIQVNSLMDGYPETVAVEFVGSTIKCYVNGTQVGTTQTDSFNASETKHGIVSIGQTGAGYIDNWKLYQQSVGRGRPPRRALQAVQRASSW